MRQRSGRRTPSSWSVILRRLGGTRLRVWVIKHVVSPPDRWLYQCTAGRRVTLGRPLVPLLRLSTTECRTGRALSQAARAWGWLSYFTFSFCTVLSTFQDRLDGLQSFLQMAKKTACNMWLKDFEESSRKHDLPLDEPCPIVLC